MFYQRFACVHGYQMIQVDEPFQLDDKGEVVLSRYKMEVIERREDKPIVRYRRGSPE